MSLEKSQATVSVLKSKAAAAKKEGKRSEAKVFRRGMRRALRKKRILARAAAPAAKSED